MQALYLKNGTLELQDDAPKPIPETGEVLLRIRLVGICGTDRALINGYASFEGIPGHEFVAEVEAVGEGVEERWLGQRVVAEINDWCDNCPPCHNDRHNHCLNRKVIGIRNHQGAFAQYLTVSEKLLHPIPDIVTDRQAVFIEPLAAAFRVIEQLQPLRYERVLVVGAGTLGQLIARALCSQGWSPYIIVRHEKQKQRLAGLAVHIINESETETGTMDVVIEASGHPSGLELALKAVRACGAVILKSTYAKPVTLDMSALVVNEIQLIGSRCGPFDSAISAISQGHIDPEPLIDSAFPLSWYQEAFKAASRKGASKVLLEPGTSSNHKSRLS